MNLRSLIFLTLGSAICLWLSSCTPIPIPLPTGAIKPFQDEELQFLEPGGTTLAEIRQHLGEPQAIRNNGKLQIYVDRRISWFVWMGPMIEKVWLVGVLFIEMDENYRLRRYEVVNKYNDCVSWGLCLDAEMFNALDGPLKPPDEAQLFADDSIIILEQGRSEQPEYEHISEGQCKIITYLGDKSRLETLRVQIDESPKRAISRNGYLKNIIAHGNHTLSVLWPLSWEMASMKIPIRKWDFHCNNGELLFVNVFTTRGIIRSPKLNMVIDSIDEGMKTIQKRRLIID